MSRTTTQQAPTGLAALLLPAADDQVSIAKTMHKWDSIGTLPVSVNQWTLLGQAKDGCNITYVAPGSSLGDILHPGDVIKTVNSELVRNPTELWTKIAAHKVGEQVVLGLERRNGILSDHVDVKVTLDRLKPELGVAVDQWTLRGAPRAGVSVQYSWGAASGAGVAKDEVITHIDGKQISTPEDMQQSLSTMKPGQRVTLRVLGTGDWLGRPGAARDVTVILAGVPFVRKDFFGKARDHFPKF